MHARRRARKNLPPLSYHRWMVSKRHNPHHHPRYYYNPQNPHNNNHPMYNQNPYYGNGQQHPDMIGMQGGMNPPPPALDPGAEEPKEIAAARKTADKLQAQEAREAQEARSGQATEEEGEQ